jgi:hypothetical protein
VFGCATNVQMLNGQKLRIVVIINMKISRSSTPADVSPNTPKADEPNL